MPPVDEEDTEDTTAPESAQAIEDGYDMDDPATAAVDVAKKVVEKAKADGGVTEQVSDLAADSAESYYAESLAIDLMTGIFGFAFFALSINS